MSSLVLYTHRRKSLSASLPYNLPILLQHLPLPPQNQPLYAPTVPKSSQVRHEPAYQHTTPHL